MNQNLNGDEIDSLIELIITILFMSFGIFATALMVRYLSAKVELVERDDKIVMSAEAADLEDPLWFTGYQAYMFAWHMDEMSDVPITWLGGNASSIMSGGKSNDYVDGSSKTKVTIGTLDEHGETRPAFISWRNRTIVGSGYAADCSVKKTIGTIGSDYGFYKLYRGTGSPGCFYHLELTDKYTQNADLGSNPNTGGKTFSWVLAPYRH